MSSWAKATLEHSPSCLVERRSFNINCLIRIFSIIWFNYLIQSDYSIIWIIQLFWIIQFIIIQLFDSIWFKIFSIISLSSLVTTTICYEESKY